MSTTPVLQGHHTIGNESIAYVVHPNSTATTPDHTFIGLARYHGKTLVLLANNAEDCWLGVLCLFQEVALKQTATNKRILFDGSIPADRTTH